MFSCRHDTYDCVQVGVVPASRAGLHISSYLNAFGPRQTYGRTVTGDAGGLETTEVLAAPGAALTGRSELRS